MNATMNQERATSTPAMRTPRKQPSIRRAVRPEPLPVLTQVDISSVLRDWNVRWVQPEFTLLKPPGFGSNLDRDISAYVRVNDTLFGVHRRVFFDGTDSELRVFLGSFPVVIDLSEHFFGQAPRVSITVDQRLKRLIVSHCEQARMATVDFWVDAVRRAPHELNLEQLMKHVAHLSSDATWDNGLRRDVVKKLGFDRFEDEGRLVKLMSCEPYSSNTFNMPTWVGDQEVKCNVFLARGLRHWVNVVKGIYTPLGCCLATVQLQRGPLAVVTAGSVAARSVCEELIRDGKYGDVVLLIGEGRPLKDMAQRMSNYLFGVDIIEL